MGGQQKWKWSYHKYCISLDKGPDAHLKFHLSEKGLLIRGVLVKKLSTSTDWLKLKLKKVSLVSLLFNKVRKVVKGRCLFEKTFNQFLCFVFFQVLYERAEWWKLCMKSTNQPGSTLILLSQSFKHPLAQPLNTTKNWKVCWAEHRFVWNN